MDVSIYVEAQFTRLTQSEFIHAMQASLKHGLRKNMAVSCEDDCWFSFECTVELCKPLDAGLADELVGILKDLPQVKMTVVRGHVVEDRKAVLSQGAAWLHLGAFFGVMAEMDDFHIEILPDTAEAVEDAEARVSPEPTHQMNELAARRPGALN